MAAEPPAQWSRAQRGLHWGIALLMLCTVPMGLVMVALPFRLLLLKFVLYQVHKSIGIVLLALACTLLVLHWRRGRPPLHAGMPRWQVRAAGWGQAALFTLVIVTPCVGYLVAATAPVRIPTLFLGVLPVPHIVGTNPALYARLHPVHLWLALLLAGLACGHAFMAWRHHRAGLPTLRQLWKG
jgi:cytochrome b561